MAKNDFRPWSAPEGGHASIRYARLASAATFQAGEPVRLDSSGNLVECSDATATGTDLAGIAMVSGDTVGAASPSGDPNGAFRFKVGAFTPGTGLPVAGDLVPYVVPSPTQLFITANWDDATDGGLNTPAAALIGSSAGIQLASNVWSLAGATDPALCRVMDVLDANYSSVQFSGGTGKFVVFTINAHQSGSVAVITDAT